MIQYHLLEVNYILKFINTFVDLFFVNQFGIATKTFLFKLLTIEKIPDDSNILDHLQVVAIIGSRCDNANDFEKMLKEICPTSIELLINEFNPQQMDKLLIAVVFNLFPMFTQKEYMNAVKYFLIPLISNQSTDGK